MSVGEGGPFPLGQQSNPATVDDAIGSGIRRHSATVPTNFAICTADEILAKAPIAQIDIGKLVARGRRRTPAAS